MKQEQLGVKAPKKQCTNKKCPFHGQLNVKKELFRGTVVKRDAHHSATIEWKRPFYIPKYERYEVRKSRLRVHNPPCLGAQVGQEVIADQDSLQPRVIAPPPEFQTRSVVKNLFNKFVDDVAAKTSIPGVQLSWIGVGTWKTPDEIVPEKHIEAWKLSSENLIRGAEDKLDKLRNEAHLQQVLRLIQNIPLARFQQTPNRNGHSFCFHRRPQPDGR